MSLTWATGVRFGRATRRNERKNELHLAANAYGSLGHCRVFGPLSFLGPFRISVLIYMSL
ncbi:hypothetical protein Hanom_Chr07g00581031 [Helianthus anomalus]